VRTSGASRSSGQAVWRLVLTSALTALMAGLMTGVLASGGLASGAGVARAKTSSHKITVHKATGSAVTIGLISDAGGSGGATATGRLVEQGAKAATEYWNADLGGLEGHKVNLYICENQSTPTGGQSCAGAMVAHGVVAVVEPFTAEGQTEVPTIVGAGIPYIVVDGTATAELTTPGAYDLEGGFPAELGAMALSAKENGDKKVVLLVENVPAAIQGVQTLGGIVYKAAGVDLQIVTVNPGTADVTSQLQSAAAGGANAVGVIGDLPLCRSFFDGYAALHLTLPRYVLSTCQDPSIEHSATLDKELAGSFVTTATEPTKADQKEYAAIVKAFLPKVSTNPTVSTLQADGVTAVLTLANVMKGSTLPVTAPGIKLAIGAGKNVVIPLSGGLTFTCNGKAIPQLPSVCSSSSAIGTVQAGKSGTVTKAKVYDPTPLF
jgi:branched-chain amino acid transport system substrate-binding protein